MEDELGVLQYQNLLKQEKEDDSQIEIMMILTD